MAGEVETALAAEDVAPVSVQSVPAEVTASGGGVAHADDASTKVSAAEASSNASTAPLNGEAVLAPEDANAHQATENRNAATADVQLKAIGKEEVTAPVVEILRGITTSVGVEAELQCTLCHEVLYKPVTTPCGHSFCRVCLLEFLLSRDVDDAQCPVCRGLVLHSSLGSDADDAAPVFSINVTLWNIIQLLVPALGDRDHSEEDADYGLKYDQFDAKWRIAALHQSSQNVARTRDERNLRRRRRDGDEIESSDDEEGMEGEESEDDEHDDRPSRRRRRTQYPQLRQENIVDGHLEVVRNVVLDRDDANEDGYEGMRMSLAIMEFPSLFQPYNEHQECSIAVLKFEEDEDMDGGVPLFTSDDGDDDALIISDYFNEIRLRVTDDEGNVVMERTRGATQGIASFPGLRLDVPAGMYNFEFSDDLYGVRLTIRTELRELRDEIDAPMEDFHEGSRRFVLDQAGERNRSQRRRQPHSEDEDEGDDSGSDDSFIVNDDEVEHGAEEAQFSGSEEDEWSQGSDEDEEESMERHENARQQRRLVRRLRQSSEEDHDDGAEERSDDGDSDHNAGEELQPESDSEDNNSSATSVRSVGRTRIIDDDSDSDDGENQRRDNDAQLVEATSGEPAGPTTTVDDPQVIASPPIQRRPAKRSRTIMESDDDESDSDNESNGVRNGGNGSDDAGDTSIQHAAEPRGFTSNKRLRLGGPSSRIFHDDDDSDDAENDDQADANLDEDGVGEEETGSSRPRWIGSDPYWTRRRREGEFVNDAEDEPDDGSEDEGDVPPGREQFPGQGACGDDDFSRDEGDDEDRASGSDNDGTAWEEGNTIEDDLGDDGFSD